MKNVLYYKISSSEADHNGCTFFKEPFLHHNCCWYFHGVLLVNRSWCRNSFILYIIRNNSCSSVWVFLGISPKILVPKNVNNLCGLQSQNQLTCFTEMSWLNFFQTYYNIFHLLKCMSKFSVAVKCFGIQEHFDIKKSSEECMGYMCTRIYNIIVLKLIKEFNILILVVQRRRKINQQALPRSWLIFKQF